MDVSPADLLADASVRSALRRAWQESNPGISGGHEVGGFITESNAGDVGVMRWPAGGQDSIIVPPYANGRVEGKTILATFHTHPNTGSDYQQEPSLTDTRAVEDDPDLKSDDYVGEFVLSDQLIYLIAPTGRVSVIGGRVEVLGD